MLPENHKNVETGKMRAPAVRRHALLAVAALALLGLGCRQDMHDGPYVEPLEASTFFANGMGSRPLIEGTVARGWLREDSRLWLGTDEQGEPVETIPVTVDRDLLERGRERYDIYCSVCHGGTGAGDGMIVRRGFKKPPALSEQRLRDMPAGYFYDVITNGFGLMSSYAKQVPMKDRWAIVAYVRALQLSQAASLDALPEPIQEEFHAALAEAEAAAAAAAEHGDGQHGSDDHGSDDHSSEAEHGDAAAGEHH